jgi:hypothetical protein
MSFREQNEPKGTARLQEGCRAARDGFSAYLDGSMSGVEMTSISAHLGGCARCAAEFGVWRDVQRALGELGPATAPVSLQARLREAIATERKRGTYLAFNQRALLAWKKSIAPMALRVSGGLAAALVLVAALGWIVAAPNSVQANDDRMAHIVAPRYLYSAVPPLPIETRRDTPIVVQAKVDTDGRVYDYAILAGPNNAQVRTEIENDLLESIFQPATAFGVPVRGHLVMIFAGVSVRG